ncbi:MAG: hypothetical protein ACAH95_03625 [Fimbriimonas sp.]
MAVSAMAFATVDGLSIKRTPKEGQTLKYKMEATTDMGGSPVTMSASLVEKVVKVEANGNFSLEQLQTDAKVNMGGQEQDIPSGEPATTTYKASGEVVEIKSPGETAGAYRMSTLGLLVDPGKLVNVGDKWTHEVKADPKLGFVAAKADYQVMAEEKVGAYDTIKIKATIKETEGTDPASSETTLWIDKKDGTTVKAETKWNRAPVPTPQGVVILDANLKLTRVD